jgi:hypothetical protein
MLNIERPFGFLRPPSCAGKTTMIKVLDLFLIERLSLANVSEKQF